MTRFGFVSGKPFYVVNKQWMGKVWYVNNNRHVYIRKRDDKSNPQYQRNTFFFDAKTKTIRSTDKDYKDKFALDARSHATYVNNIDSRYYQMFNLDNGYIEVTNNNANENRQVLTIQHHDEHDDRHIVRENKAGKEEDWQMWDIWYTDSMPSGDKEGEFNEQWGFYVGKPFHIVSILGEQRYASVSGQDLVIAKPNGKDTQLFYIGEDGRIHPKGQTGKSLDIHGANSGKVRVENNKNIGGNQ